MNKFLPSHWSVGNKLAVVLLFAALIPLGLTSWFNLSGALSNLKESEKHNLALLAYGVANRLDQLLIDAKRLGQQIANDEEVKAFTVEYQKDDINPLHQSSSQSLFKTIIDTNDNFYSVFLLDKNGVCITSTNKSNIGKSYAFRNYYKQARKGHSFVSDVVVGSTTFRQGIYVSNPIMDKATGEVAGIIVMKLKGEAVFDIISDLHSHSDEVTTAQAFLVDRHGIVISHPDEEWLYRSLAPVSQKPEQIKKRFRKISVIENMELPELANVIRNREEPDSLEYQMQDQSQHVAGYSAIPNKSWMLFVTKPYESFAEPLNQLIQKTIFIFLLVLIVTVNLAWFLSKLLVRPLKLLTSAAERIEEGFIEKSDLLITSHDEFGHLQNAFNEMSRSLVERERERDIFGRVVSPIVREQLLSGELQLGGESRRVTVLFSDIRGFSTLSEQLSAQDIVAILNEYLEVMTDAIRPYGGYINNFIGDAIVVVFGAPSEDAGSELRAAQSAVAMRQALLNWNKQRRAAGQPEINNGVGISSGMVVAGLIGSLERLMYTVIGDAVNIAARLEGLTKEKNCSILINSGTAEALVDIDGLMMENLGLCEVKGRVKPVNVFSIDENSQIL